MSGEQQFAFDNWEDAAEQIQNLDQQQNEKNKEEQTAKIENVDHQQQAVEKKEAAKVSLKQKIKQYKQLSQQQFDQKYANISENSRGAIKTSVSTIMKSEKDFKSFANQVAERLGRDVQEGQTLNEDHVLNFVEELTLYMYNGLEWENFVEIKKKLKIVKNQRKADDKKAAKTKKKEKKQDNKNEEQNEKIINAQTHEDDLFGGAGMNSKQQEQERKKKALEKKMQKQQTQTQRVVEKEEKKEETISQVQANEDEDSDQFM